MIWHYGNVTLPLNMLATGLSENMISNHALSLAAALTLKYFFIQFLLLDALNSRPQCTMEPLVSERPLQKLKIPRKYPHQSSLWSRRIPDYFWASILQNILSFISSKAIDFEDSASQRDGLNWCQRSCEGSEARPNANIWVLRIPLILSQSWAKQNLADTFLNLYVEQKSKAHIYTR